MASTIYTFDQIHAVDPSNPQVVASNGVVTIFAPGDLTLTPIPIFSPDGLPMANPVIVNAQGYGQAFFSQTYDRVGWSGGGFSGFFTSYEGMKNEAVAARVAAQAAQAAAEQALQLVSSPTSDALIQLLTDPQSVVRELLDTVYAPFGTDTGDTAAWITDENNDGIFELSTDSHLVLDPDNEGIFKIVGQ